MMRKVLKVSDGTLLLDNGTVLRIRPNSGCPSGYYEITALNDCENVITRVEVITGAEYTDPTDGDSDKTVYRIFVYAENKQINLLSVEGSDGISS
jgi:hypothetical protein